MCFIMTDANWQFSKGKFQQHTRQQLEIFCNVFNEIDLITIQREAVIFLTCENHFSSP